MIFVISEDKGKEIRIVMEESDLTLPNLITNKLWDYEDVAFSGYKKEHPLIPKIEIVVRTKNTEVKKVIKQCINDLKQDFKNILDVI